MVEFFKRLLPDNDDSSTKAGRSAVFYSSNEDPTLINFPYKTKYRVAYCQSTGIERSHNEDSIFILNCLMDGMDTPEIFGIYLVADGMGGHQSGEVASRLAAQGSSQFLIERVFNEYIYDRNSFSDEELEQLAIQAVHEAQTLIQRRVPGGGTTLTLVMAVGDRMFSSHVGDSRLYLISPDGKMTLRTKDHSLVKRLVDLGEITENEASVHPKRNVLYRALGQTDPFEPDTEKFSLAVGERILICSDGLWGVVKENEMQRINNSLSDLEEIACHLVQAANKSGGPDNISVVLVERLA